jgi:DNA-binding CsgD family transcriptional regulator
MTAPVLTNSLDSLSVDPLFGYRPRLPIAPRTQRLHPKTNISRLRDQFTCPPHEQGELNQIWSQLLDMLPQGVIVLSRQLKPMYCNQKAQVLCQALTGEACFGKNLPLPVSEACYAVTRDQAALGSTLMMECQLSSGHSMRLSAQLMELEIIGEERLRPLAAAATLSTQKEPCIVVFLENCSEVMQQEAKIQQRKFDLTDREAEIWMLLRQELTYQEIARTLQISLNTVKTHVKNVYAKRRGGQGREKFWY